MEAKRNRVVSSKKLRSRGETRELDPGITAARSPSWRQVHYIRPDPATGLTSVRWGSRLDCEK